MKTKHALIILAMGYLVYFAGLSYKLTHWGSGDSILIVAAVLKILGVVIFLIKLFTYPKVREFLNW